MRCMLSIASRTEYVLFDFRMKRSRPASKSRSAISAGCFTWRTTSTAMWLAKVVAPLPPRAETKPKIRPRPLDRALDVAAPYQGQILECVAQCFRQRGIEKFARAGAERVENVLGRRLRMQHEDGRLRTGIAQPPDKLFERQRQSMGLDQYHVGAVTLDAIEQRVEIVRIVLLEGDAHGQVLYAGVRLLPQLAVRDHQSGGKGHHALISPL